MSSYYAYYSHPSEGITKFFCIDKGAEGYGYKREKDERFFTQAELAKNNYQKIKCLPTDFLSYRLINKFLAVIKKTENGAVSYWYKTTLGNEGMNTNEFLVNLDEKEKQLKDYLKVIEEIKKKIEDRFNNS